MPIRMLVSGQSNRAVSRNEPDESKANYTGILLCGGKGTRLAQVRGEIPKPLFKIADKELIRYSIEQMDPSVVEELVFATDYRAEEIESWANSARIPYDFRFSRQTSPGIPSAVQDALLQIQNDRIIICNTDEIRINFNMLGAVQFHEAHGSPATVVVTYGTNLHRHTLLEIDENRRVTNTIPNPNVPKDQHGLIDTSFFIMNRDAVTSFDFQETTSYSGITRPLALTGQLRAYIEQNMVYLNINTGEEVEEAKRALR